MRFKKSKAEWRSFKTKKALEKFLYQQEIKHFYWTFVYMKLYNNSQKLHRVNHYTKWNEIVKHLIKNEGIHSNITVGSPLGRAVWQENTPNSSTRYRENFHTQKYSSRQLIYTKATRISLQHQILILYTAFSWKVAFRRRRVSEGCMRILCWAIGLCFVVAVVSLFQVIGCGCRSCLRALVGFSKR